MAYGALRTAHVFDGIANTSIAARCVDSPRDTSEDD